MSYDFEAQRRAWANPPVDDVGYISSEEMLGYDDEKLRQLVMGLMSTRYGGWRNHGNGWLSTLMRVAEPARGRTLVDYGCGVGLESLTYALMGYQVIPADIVESNVDLTQRVLELFGLEPLQAWRLDRDGVIDRFSGTVDVFHCSGVLHHIPHARQVMEEAYRLLAPDGEARLMLYSDEGWRLYTGTEPPVEVTADPHFRDFVRTFDQVGEYADWYNRARLEQRFGDLFVVEEVHYITDNRRYLTALLRRI